MEVQPFLVEDSISEEKDIAWAVRRLCLKRLVSLSYMRAEHLLQWLISATWDNTPDATNWKKVVDIVKKAFHVGTLSK